MAESGTIQLNVTSQAGAVKGWIQWTESDVDAAANTSKVTARLIYRNDGGWDTYSDGSTFYLTVNGSTVRRSSGGRVPHGGGTFTALTHAVTVPHGADGAKSVILSAGGALTGTVGLSASSGSGTAVLTPIPRATVPVLPAWAEIGSEITVALPRADPTFTHDLSWRLGEEGAFTDLARGAETACVWTVPPALCDALPDAESGTVWIRAVTKRGEAVIGDASASLTVKVPADQAPAASLSVTPVNSNAVVAGWGAVVRGFTALRWQLTADLTGDRGASTAAYAFECPGESREGASGTTGPLTAAGPVTVRGRVRDSRGRWSPWAEETVAVLDYGPPVILRSGAWRVNGQGAAADDGEQIKAVLSGRVSQVGSNAASLRWRWRRTGGAWSDYGALTDNAETVLPGILFPRSQSFEVELSVWDSLGGSKAVICTVPTADAAFHLRAGGKAAGFGKYARRDNLLDVAWDANIDGGLTVRGRNMEHTLPLYGLARLTAGADLDGLTDVGVWYCDGADAVSIAHSPYRAYNYKVSVERIGGAGYTDLQQVLTATGSEPAFFVRRRIGGAWKPWRRLTLEDGARVYDMSLDPCWSVQLSRPGYVTANLTRTCRNVPVASRYASGVGVTDYLYLPLPYPMTNPTLTGVGDTEGIYLSTMNREGNVGAKYKLFTPVSGSAIAAVNLRLSLCGPVARPPLHPAVAYDAAAGAQAAAVAQSYVDAREGGRAFAYGANWFYPCADPTTDPDHNTVNDGNGAGLIECDTYMGLVLRGVDYDRSPYKTYTAPGAPYDQPRSPMPDVYADLPVNPDNRTWAANLLQALENNPYYGRDLVYAADLAWAMWYMGRVFADADDARTGDLVFWNDPYGDKTYFAHITHVGLIKREDGELRVYEVTTAGRSGGRVVQCVTLTEACALRGEPYCFARIC